MNDISDPEWEKARAILYRKIKNDEKPVGEIENQWVNQIVFHSLANDPVKMRVAVGALKKSQWLRTHQTDAAATLKALESF